MTKTANHAIKGLFDKVLAFREFKKVIDSNEANAKTLAAKKNQIAIPLMSDDLKKPLNSKKSTFPEAEEEDFSMAAIRALAKKVQDAQVEIGSYTKQQLREYDYSFTMEELHTKWKNEAKKLKLTYTENKIRNNILEMALGAPDQSSESKQVYQTMITWLASHPNDIGMKDLIREFDDLARSANVQRQRSR